MHADIKAATCTNVLGKENDAKDLCSFTQPISTNKAIPTGKFGAKGR